ncbi:MAG: LPS export ABC transporter periplasmic protein LptC [Candidatus Omnitrophica bacterium]|nr:LPS export ABC transporter periplasmic protein LptC [Candidatus Omnitrophota bacterium]
MKKIIFLFILLFFSVLFSFQSSFAQDSSQHMEGFNLVGYGDGGKKSWDVQGDTATIADKEINITNVDANSYGQENMNVTAKNGHINKQDGNMRLEKDVVITTQTGTKMLTDTLTWQKQKDLITTDDDVTILRENMKAVGQGLFARPSLNQAQLNKNVVVEYQPTANNEGPMKEAIKISCDGPMEVDYKGQSAVFHDHVVAFQAGRNLTADQMELFFDAAKKQIKTIICTGNVVIVQGQNTSSSDKAIYDASEQKIKLYGHPKLLMYMGDKGEKDKNVPFGS